MILSFILFMMHFIHETWPTLQTGRDRDISPSRSFVDGLAWFYIQHQRLMMMINILMMIKFSLSRSTSHHTYTYFHL